MGKPLNATMHGAAQWQARAGAGVRLAHLPACLPAHGLHCVRPERRLAICAATGFGRKREAKTGGPDRLSLGPSLKAISLAIVGDDGVLNREVAEEVGRALKYVPLHTSDIIKKASGKSVAAIREQEGPTAVGVAEMQVLASLSTQLRAAVSTCGGGHGAAARAACWRYLFGHVTAWVDVEPQQSKEDAPQRGAYANADVVVQVDPSVARLGPGGAAKVLRPRVMEAVETLLRSEAKQPTDLPFRKALYIKLGCRGDWPTIMPPDWNPDEEGDEPSQDATQ